MCDGGLHTHVHVLVHNAQLQQRLVWHCLFIEVNLAWNAARTMAMQWQWGLLRIGFLIQRVRCGKVNQLPGNRKCR